jgi:hypothetical protein
MTSAERILYQEGAIDVMQRTLESKERMLQTTEQTIRSLEKSVDRLTEIVRITRAALLSEDLEYRRTVHDTLMATNAYDPR